MNCTTNLLEHAGLNFQSDRIQPKQAPNQIYLTFFRIQGLTITSRQYEPCHGERVTTREEDTLASHSYINDGKSGQYRESKRCLHGQMLWFSKAQTTHFYEDMTHYLVKIHTMMKELCTKSVFGVFTGNLKETWMNYR